eukprot:TRINITY_DN11438_c0_g1_i1.p2 TRINITY_DN11438_c0_g1~~TRINITY_DN11438_c0_g1_i1.p2  ORF type:complete len:78 (-),score=6.26 TRINITY_DN11438_c0_g1_i1:130-363(-)
MFHFKRSYKKTDNSQPKVIDKNHRVSNMTLSAPSGNKSEDTSTTECIAEKVKCKEIEPIVIKMETPLSNFLVEQRLS